ncbi:MAG: hypothetical protein GWP44_11280, partial [Proteobacteria bacterium]|nr:hypothetical protein [Pseudomonadota bacterium]
MVFLRKARLFLGPDIARPEGRPCSIPLAVRTLVDEDGVIAVLASLLLVLWTGLGCDEEDLATVQRPPVRANGGLMLAELRGLATVGAQKEELRLLIRRPGNRDLGAIRGELDTRATLLANEPEGLPILGWDLPPGRLSFALAPLHFRLREEDPTSIGR